jgi:hypothetical protein
MSIPDVFAKDITIKISKDGGVLFLIDDKPIGMLQQLVLVVRADYGVPILSITEDRQQMLSECEFNTLCDQLRPTTIWREDVLAILRNKYPDEKWVM